jgi:transcription initiation factor TFIIIB Brf1 subunit/transcription initiation factor TFIIB
MKDCPDCGATDMMYSRRNDERCALCGYVHSTDPIETDKPFRRVDSECGEIISDYFERATRGAVRRLSTNDDDTCSVRPSGLNKQKQKVYTVACYHHKD